MPAKLDTICAHTVQAVAGPEAAPNYTNKKTYNLSYHIDVTGSSPIKAVTSGSHNIDDSLTIINKGATVTIGEDGPSNIPVVCTRRCNCSELEPLCNSVVSCNAIHQI